MLYRKGPNGEQLSQLGYGCMRFTKNGNNTDLDKAEKELLLAIKGGVNYFDTAYIYSGNEEALGKILERNHIREKVNIATKLPQYMVHTLTGIDKVFDEELFRLRTNYIDYYLFHMFTDISEWEALEKIGIREWIRNKKAAGQIRNIGFSYHGDTDMFLKLLDAYPWDFCQVQYNYLDEHTQAGRRGVEAAEEKGIPVIIMEPLRGGKLINLPQEAQKLIREDPDIASAAELGLSWLWNQTGVTVILSGMNSEEMVKENLKLADKYTPGSLPPSAGALTEKVKAVIKQKEKVGCTLCRYCQPCPMGIDIPAYFHYYNLMYIDKKSSARFEFARAAGMRKDPIFASRCIGCGKCESHCPQKLSIREKLKEADKALRPLPYKIAISLARKIMIR